MIEHSARRDDRHGAALTAPEVAVMALMADGLTARAAGRRLGRSPRTVEKHLQRIYAKLGVNDRVSAVLHAQCLGVLAHPSTR